ncbi:hypothetical protein RHGRI_005308 [Rhododendron griersonianum]|uniref:RING-type domain-containing protein n=1 Tax=Rhododendron griersonianum TaxID=479676 RepID=A0AAV6LCK8_9ERIC|nr:hypothetical protein RHGRI_005308 [Rhododendron griersonianum]
MCTHGHPQEAASRPEPVAELASVELVAVDPVRGAGPVAAVRLDPNVINLLSLLSFLFNGPDGFGGSECQMYLEQFMHMENIGVLPTCRHIFHDDCIKTWLNNNTECIVCRHEYLG